ncbi:MAG: hypothetical protein J6X84_00945 [Treponema sp.]|nr:hypothetical protein [Treponema sp.]
MLLYIFAIGFTMVLVFCGNFFWFPIEMSLLKVSLLTFMLPFLIVAWDGIFATIIRHALPAKWFSKDLKINQVSKGECKFYELLGIKYWKDHVLELGMFTSFSKKKVADHNDPAYVERFILECNYGVAVHLWNLILGFPLMLFFPDYIAIRFILPAVIANSVLSLLPLMILRYNIPRLERLLAVLKKKAERAEKSAAKTSANS